MKDNPELKQDSDGDWYVEGDIAYVKGSVGFVMGDVKGSVTGDVGYVKGNVLGSGMGDVYKNVWGGVEGNVERVKGNVAYVQGDVTGGAPINPTEKVAHEYIATLEAMIAELKAENEHIEFRARVILDLLGGRRWTGEDTIRKLDSLELELENNDE